MKPLAAAAALIIALGVAACSSSDDSGSSTTSTSSTTTSAGDGDAGQLIAEPGPIALAVGETATITLDANPTTGYQWELSSEPDDSVVTVVSDTYLAPDSNVVGAGGTQEIVVEGVGVGTTTLELRYVRPWESDEPPAETASYAVSVD